MKSNKNVIDGMLPSFGKRLRRVDLQRIKANKKSKHKIQCVGTRSIHDVINNSPELSTKNKIDYIRHKYTYYDGNHEFFHHPNGAPNKLKHELNSLIYAVVNKEVDPSELKEFNNRIVNLRYSWDAQQQMEKENERGLQETASKVAAWKHYFENSTWYTSTIQDDRGRAFIKDAISFIVSPQNTLTMNMWMTAPRRAMCKFIHLWKKSLVTGCPVDYSRELELVKETLEEERVQRRVERQMREYAKDLGFTEEHKNAN